MRSRGRREDRPDGHMAAGGAVSRGNGRGGFRGQTHAARPDYASRTSELQRQLLDHCLTG